MTISDLFIQSILEKINSPRVIGVGISGGVARGQVAKYSDVDFDIFVTKLPERDFDQYTLRYWSEKLVSLKYVTIEGERAAMMDPRRANSFTWKTPQMALSPPRKNTTVICPSILAPAMKFPSMIWPR